MPSVTSITARSHPDHYIGFENSLPWHLRTDLRHFRKRTSGHVIIMGRKTFDSIGRALPDRVSIVLTRETFRNSEEVIWVNDRETALLWADIKSIYLEQTSIYIIGGVSMYEAFQDLINEVWLTDVFTGPIRGDAKFDYEFWPEHWRCVFEEDYPASETDDFPFRISHLVKRKKTFRERGREELLRRDPAIADLLGRWESEVLKAEDDKEGQHDGSDRQQELFVADSVTSSSAG